ncbi:MAG: DUF1972 domain-containing protein [Rhodobacteraceae bacterium]|nr:DUF1972 domain-containing protein [Paracoccaceae bacterium]
MLSKNKGLNDVRVQNKIAIVGTVGVPGRYGGFETLAENLVRHHKRTGKAVELTVWCSVTAKTDRPQRFENADLRYLRLKANGIQSILYDMVSLLDAVRTRHDRIILLGVSGALSLPLIRLISKAQIVTNIDGIEWKREKWSALARAFLRASEWAAVRFSHDVIADNQAIADHVRENYDSNCHVIAYGGDHALEHRHNVDPPAVLPDSYALALCRIEPENNIHMILGAWSQSDQPLVFVGNWGNSDYGSKLRAQFAAQPNIHLLDPIYDPDLLYALRSRATLYLHGHSAGGTNPSLVEMMHFGMPVLAFDCVFNRNTTENKALYFTTADELAGLLQNQSSDRYRAIGKDMSEIAQQRYTWEKIAESYFALVGVGTQSKHSGKR